MIRSQDRMLSVMIAYFTIQSMCLFAQATFGVQAVIKEAERDDDQNEDEELDNLEDDYAYYYNSENDDDDDEDEVKGQKSVAIEE